MKKTPELVRGIIETVCVREEFSPTVSIDDIVTALMENNPLPQHPEKDEEVMGYIQEAVEHTFNLYKPDENAQWMQDAPKIPVIIGDREYQTYMDSHRVQRFVSNPIIRHAVDNLSTDSYNNIFVKYYKGEVSHEELTDFLTSSGYSVSALSGMNAYSHLPIKNPLWEKKNK